ncbi:transcriptional repressor DicA [compost metagenome]
MKKNETLVEARREKGFTQEELAVSLGYSKATVSNWENGHSSPSLADVFKVSRVLRKDINILFSGLDIQDSHTYSEQSTTTKDTA